MNTTAPCWARLGRLSALLPRLRCFRTHGLGAWAALRDMLRATAPPPLRLSAWITLGSGWTASYNAVRLSSSKGTISALSRGMCQRLRIRRGAAVRARNHPVSVSFGPLVSVTATLAGFWMVQDRSRTAVVEVA